MVGVLVAPNRQGGAVFGRRERPGVLANITLSGGPPLLFRINGIRAGKMNLKNVLSKGLVGAFFFWAMINALAWGAGEIDAGPSQDRSYRIGSGDILEIKTWKEPDFTMPVMVRLDGMITLPLLDDIPAAGRTPVEVKADIENRLKQYLEVPSVTVIVKNSISQKIYILGEVAHTGEYQLVKDLTILQAFALAGGFTEWASKKEIILLRRDQGKPKMIRINYKKIIKGEDLEQDVRLRADDTIIVP